MCYEIDKILNSTLKMTSIRNGIAIMSKMYHKTYPNDLSGKDFNYYNKLKLL